MHLNINLLILLLIKLIDSVKSAAVVCYVDSTTPTKITVSDVENALDHCNHLVYGFATLTPKYYTLTFDGSVDRSLKLTDIAVLKKKYPRIKFLLSVGGGRDHSDGSKYLEFLEASPAKQAEFIASSLRLMSFYEFDGLDLAYQFPRSEPFKSYTGAVQFWRRIFRKKSKVDPKAGQHKQLFTNFIQNLSSIYKAENKMLTLSVLPNVNSSLYFDVPAIVKHMDLVTLWAFDFNTPNRNPREANYPAPLMAPPTNGDNSADAYNNVNFQVQHWLSQTQLNHKIILGVPAYARTWQMSTKSPRNGMPIVKQTQGPAEMGDESKTPGLLSWPEVCELLTERRRRVKGSMEYGQYFVYPPHDNVTLSTWTAFDGPNVAHYKGLYGRTNQLGGMALIDLSMDDFAGKCTDSKYPILKYMNGLFN